MQRFKAAGSPTRSAADLLPSARSERQKAAQALAAKKFNAHRRSFMDAIKDLPCQDCGGRFPPVCMDFDHRDPDLKSFAISQGYVAKNDPEGLRTLMLEVSKCDLVCSNCHRIRTQKQHEDGIL